MGVTVTTFGLFQINPSDWANLSKILTDFRVLIFFVILVGGGIEYFSRRLNLNRLSVGVVLILFLSIAAGMLWQLTVCILFGFSCFIVGRELLRVLGINTEVLSGSVIFLVGATIFATIIGLWAHTPYNYKGIYSLVLFGPLLFEKGIFQNFFQIIKSVRIQSPISNLFETVIATVALIYFLLALMPEVGYDSLVSHLFLPEFIAYNHQWNFDVTKYVWTVMPMQGDWIYTLVNMLAGEYAVRIINISFIFVLCWLIHDLVNWAGGNDLGGKCSILIFLLTPLTFLEASSLYIESIWSAFIVGGTLSFFKLMTSDNKKENLIVSAVLLSSGLAAKAVTFMALPVLLLFCLVGYKYWYKKSVIPSILLGLMIFFLIGSIPYFTAYLITGNPVFPFFNEYFQSPFYSTAKFGGSIYGTGVTWDTIYNITFNASNYLEGGLGSAGFQWLLLLLPSLVFLGFMKHRKGLALAFFAIMVFVFTFYATAYLRYIFPSVVMLCAVIGISISNVFFNQKKHLRHILYTFIIITIGLNVFFLRSATHYGSIKLEPIFSEGGRRDYIQSRLPIRNAVSLINELNFHNTPVAVFSEPQVAGMKADYLVPNWYNNTFQGLIFSADTSQKMQKIFFDNGVEFIILDEGWYTNETRLILQDVTVHIQSFGSISVRRVKARNIELINDKQFVENEFWHFSEGVKRNNPGVTVSVNSPATQIVAVKEKRNYLLSVRASCVTDIATVRMQVIWMDKKKVLIEPFIKVFECSRVSKRHSVQVFSPKSASFGLVFAVGHSNVPINVEEVSFQK